MAVKLGPNYVELTDEAAHAFWQMMAWSGWALHGRTASFLQCFKEFEAQLRRDGASWEELS